jgi:hypothetical protein
MAMLGAATCFAYRTFFEAKPMGLQEGRGRTSARPASPAAYHESMLRGPWLITGTLVGALFGFLFTGSMGGDPDAVVVAIRLSPPLVCAMIGFSIGLIVDRFGNRKRPQDDNEPNSN